MQDCTESAFEGKACKRLHAMCGENVKHWQNLYKVKYSQHWLCPSHKWEEVTTQPTVQNTDDQIWLDSNGEGRTNWDTREVSFEN